MRDVESLQTPQEIIQSKEGTCEDLTRLIISLLENIGIKTYLVLTEDHIYPMALNIDSTKIWNYIESSLIDQVEKDWGENFSFKLS